jgi:Tfp pilus assembly protein PilO
MLRSTISLTAIIIAGAIFFLYTQPTYDQSKTIQTQIANYDTALQKAAELQTLKQQLLARYNAFNPSDIERLQKLLPDHVDNIRLILDMDNIATHDGMSLSNVDISGNTSMAGDTKTVIGSLGAGTQKYSTLTIAFSTSGTYTDFKKFLSDLQSSLRIVDMTTLTISPGGAVAVLPGQQQTSNEPVFTFGIGLKTYWLK